MAFIGEIRLFAQSGIPDGWLPCDGGVVSISGNQALFSLLGRRFGGDGIKTFQLPDLRGRTPVGAGIRAPGDGLLLAAQGGQETVALQQAHFPEHHHEFVATQSNADRQTPQDNYFAIGGENPGTKQPQKIYVDSASGGASRVVLNAASLTTAGGSIPRPNMQPYAVVVYCIATIGQYPALINGGGSA